MKKIIENKRKKQLHAAWPYLSASTCTAARHWPANVPAPTSVAHAAHKHGSSQPAKRQPPGNSISPALHTQAEKGGTVPPRLPGTTAPAYLFESYAGKKFGKKRKVPDKIWYP